MRTQAASQNQRDHTAVVIVHTFVVSFTIEPVCTHFTHTHSSCHSWPVQTDYICTVSGHSALPAPVAWWCRCSDCLQLVVGPSTFLDLGSGMDCPKTLFRRRHFQVSGADLNTSSSSSHILILSSNCTFDTIAVLVVMFIT